MVQSQTGSLRGLKTLVAFLGLLVVLGTAVVVGVVIKRLYATPPPASNFSAPSALPPPCGVAPQFAATTLVPGARIEGVAAAGGSFAVWVIDPAGGQAIYVLDPATGALHLAMQAPAAKN